VGAREQSPNPLQQFQSREQQNPSGAQQKQNLFLATVLSVFKGLHRYFRLSSFRLARTPLRSAGSGAMPTNPITDSVFRKDNSDLGVSESETNPSADMALE
jgi:hypothetical protein